MRAINVTTFTIATGIVVAGLAGGAVSASDYPPDVPPASTTLVVTHEQPPVGAALRSGSQLAETGSDTGTVLSIAGGSVVAGTGLVLVARRRRRPAPA